MAWRFLLLLFAGVTRLLPAAGLFAIGETDRIILCGFPLAGGQLDAVWLQTYLATRMPDLSATVVDWCWDGRQDLGEISRLRPTVVLLANGGDSILERVRAAIPGARVAVVPLGGPPRNTAAAILDSWNAPDTVTLVEIDAPGKRVLASENTVVHDLESDRVVAWSQDDSAVPLPPSRDPSARLNRQFLRVRGLYRDQYRLTIDGRSMGEFSNLELEQGLDLNALPSPMKEQAQRVYELTLRRMALEYALWDQRSGDRVLRDELAREEAEVLEQRRSAGRPRTHDYEITPVR